MNYISAPVKLMGSDKGVAILRDINEQRAMMDNLVDLAVFTPKGSFNADPDFGLEYWNEEYGNISDSQFNNNTQRDEYTLLSTKEQCEAGIAQNIIDYAPEQLKIRNVYVNMSMSDGDDVLNSPSRHKVVIFVSAKLDDGLGTTSDYVREVSFMVEPTVINRRRQ